MWPPALFHDLLQLSTEQYEICSELFTFPFLHYGYHITKYLKVYAIICLVL